MMEHTNKRPLALYIHIPFCASKCLYCDFASYPNRENLWLAYKEALLDELAGWSEELSGYEVETMFFGGGTPSLWPAEYLSEILAAVRRTVSVRQDAEITMEANPGTLTPEKLHSVRAAGVNRISIGVQSLDDRLLRAIGRIHTAKEAEDAVRMAREAGFENLSLDLMYALPGQTMERWEHTLRAVVKLSPEHISAYSLIIEEGTPLCERVEKGIVETPDDDAAIEMQRMAVKILAEAGYGRYEISNYAREGYACRHNTIYWERGEYLGLGCAAHSLMKGVRFENPRELDKYLAGERRLDRMILSREDEMEETLILATRMCRGMDLQAYECSFGTDFLKEHQDAVRRLRKMGLIEVDDGFLRLTGHGMELQNAVVVELMDE